MSVAIDNIDVLILRQLIKDARTKRRDLAKMCGISSTAVTNRIEKLTTKGVIVGTGLYYRFSKLGFVLAASIEVENFKIGEEKSVIEKMKEYTNVLVRSYTVGKNNCTFFIVARSTKDVENLKQFLLKHSYTGNININFWTKTNFLFDNIEIEPSGA
jgi:Lrp/AsnC family transcriptional regulator, regulator for asnA, asnC and gidA